MKFKKTVLNNGLTIITAPMPSSPTVTVLTLTSAGADYETPENNGISHFLEHMLFKGTETRTCADINIELDSAGATSNAFTGNAYTGYYSKAHYKKLPVLLDVITDMYLNAKLPEDDIEKEKGVILEEINMYEDLPARKVGNVLETLMFKGNAAGMPILGPAENIKKFDRDTFVKYREEHYVAEGTTVIVAGNFDQPEVLREVKKKFKDISTGKKGKKSKTKIKLDGPKMAMEYKKSDQSHLRFGFHAFKGDDKRVPVLKLLSVILGGGMSSRLFTEMRDNRGLCYYTGSGVYSTSDRGVLSIRSGVGNGKLEESVEVIMDECRKLCNEEVTQKELKKAKDYLIGNIAMNLESSDDIAEFLGLQEVVYKDIKRVTDKFSAVREVTAKDIQKMAKYIFKNERLNFAVVGPLKDDKKIKKLLKF